MIDPDVRRAVKSDSITTPNVLRIKISNFEVLNDHVVGASGDSKAFAQDDAIFSDTQNGLVARHHEGVRGRLVVGYFGLWCSLGAPVVRVNSQLARGCSTVGSTSGLRSFAFSASEVEGLGDDDVQRALLTKVIGQLGVVVGCDCWSCSATSGFRTKAFGSASDSSGADGG